jgi:hypothetical protein
MLFGGKEVRHFGSQKDQIVDESSNLRLTAPLAGAILEILIAMYLSQDKVTKGNV